MSIATGTSRGRRYQPPTEKFGTSQRIVIGIVAGSSSFETYLPLSIDFCQQGASQFVRLLPPRARGSRGRFTAREDELHFMLLSPLDRLTTM